MVEQDTVLGADGFLMIGDPVRRVSGTHPFPGKVVSIFTKLNGTEMLVVESTSPDTKGMLHIYSPKQFVRATLKDTANG